MHRIIGESKWAGTEGCFIKNRYPFIWRIRCPVFLTGNGEQERDLRIMQSYYSGRTAEIQKLVERECDRMEYDGSMMFDDYPDKFMMRRICRRIEEQLEEKGKSGGSSGGEELEELIGVLLCGEMYRRRCRRRNCRAFF